MWSGYSRRETPQEHSTPSGDNANAVTIRCEKDMNMPEQHGADFYKAIGKDTLPFDDRSLAEQIAHHASVRGENPAMLFGDQKISYRQYNELAGQLANALESIGLKKGDVVGIHMPNIPQYALTLVAASKMGCVCSGISPLLTPSEVAFQIKDASIKVVLTLDLFAGIYAGLGEAVSRLDAVVVTGALDVFMPSEVALPESDVINFIHYTALVDGQPTQRETEPVHWNDTFMLQYTGGTTGKPKGVELSVRNVMHNSTQYSASTPWLEGEDIIASAFPFFHIAGLSIIFAGARSGGMMMLLPDPRDTEHFCNQMKAYPPTVLGAVPALYEMLLATPQFKEIDFSRLRVAYTGAAPLTSATFEALNNVLGKNKISDMFGMTETSPCFASNPPSRYKVGSVGMAVPGAEIRIVSLDEAKTDMPIGEPGEILATGPQVMKGYLNLPEETANSLREIDGKVWMCTGDVGYLDEEGYLFLCDRAKDMLIVGGYKVFSVELEDKLQSLPQVAMSAVIGKADEKRPGNEIVTLYVELAEDYKDADPVEMQKVIKEYCVNNMAAYKVPKEIHIIDAIPLTPVGKIDKKALRN
ncbi:long-chain-fatty-acid--CoA ligase [Maricurvus nonylphenolicus]